MTTTLRVLVLLGLLAVPVALSLASQALAEVPGPPRVPVGEVRLGPSDTATPDRAGR